ncbi:MAG: hypothetical protein ACOYN0_20065 [Phycisphaerales bacterium]
MKTVLLLAPDSPGGLPARPIGGLPPEPAPPKIQSFSQGLAGFRKGEETWKRPANNTGTGAVHVKTFHGKLNEESLAFLDQQINEWLEAHPQYDVKFVNSTVGEWQGKTKEPQLVVQLWL